MQTIDEATPKHKVDLSDWTIESEADKQFIGIEDDDALLYHLASEIIKQENEESKF